jgi:ribosomal protein S18 acetylase RimI-like enzyme
MKNNLYIEIIKPSQAEQLCRQLTTNLPEWFGIPEANERYAKGCKERTSFAAKIGNDYIGMITLEFPFPNNANIYWMAVNRNYQGQNVGSELLLAAEKYCRDHGYQSMTVETLSLEQADLNYLKTYHFYEKFGFKPLFELNTYDPDHLMCYLYKALSN